MPQGNELAYLLAQTPQDMAEARRMGEQGIANAIFSGRARQASELPQPQGGGNPAEGPLWWLGDEKKQKARALIEALKQLKGVEYGRSKGVQSGPGRAYMPDDLFVPADDPTHIDRTRALIQQLGTPMTPPRIRMPVVPSHGVIG